MNLSVRRTGALLWILVFALAAVAAAQPVPLGSAFQVNSYSSGTQSSGAVALDGQGGFVVVWQSYGQDGSKDGIFARRFNSGGVALSAELQVNSYTTESQSDPRVAREDDGDFVVVWGSTGQDGSASGVFGRRFNSAGLAQGAEFRVNSYTSGQQTDPQVAVSNGGGFVVVWGSGSQDGSAFGVFAKRFDAGGQPQGAELQVNSYTPQDQFPFGVAMDDAGGFVVSWASYGQDRSGYGVFARRFGSGGTPLGVEFQVNSYTSEEQGGGALAMAGSGDFVVAWESYADDGSDARIFVQRFDPAGLPQGVELQVNSYTNQNLKGRPLAGMDDSGDFVITWVSGGQDGSTDGIFARQFEANGAPQGAEFQVNTYTSEDQTDPSVAMNGDGRFVVTWESQDGSDYGIFARRFGALIALDVDGDGSLQPLTDGLLVLRYTFGFRGATLITGAVGPGCTRCTAPSIEAYLVGMAK